MKNENRKFCIHAQGTIPACGESNNCKGCKDYEKIFISTACKKRMNKELKLEAFVNRIKPVLKEKKVFVIRNKIHAESGRPAVPNTKYVALHEEEPAGWTPFVAFSYGHDNEERGTTEVIGEVGYLSERGYYFFTCPSDSYREGMHHSECCATSLPTAKKIVKALKETYKEFRQF